MDLVQLMMMSLVDGVSKVNRILVFSFPSFPPFSTSSRDSQTYYGRHFLSPLLRAHSGFVTVGTLHAIDRDC
jgi:hypothetical protein